MARKAQIVEVMLAMLLLFGVFPTQNRAVAATRQVLTVAPKATWRTSVGLADRVSDLLFGAAPEARRLRVFVRGVCAQTSEIRGECVCRTGRVDGLSRQMGEILLRRQALEREGRKPQIAAFLNRVRDARSNGIPEAQVRAMVREGLARGKLRPNADKECRAMQKRVEELGRQLAGARRIVAGESAELTQVSSRR